MDVWNKILSGNLDKKFKSGYMIIGPNCSDYTLSTWHCNSEKEAIDLATHFSSADGDCYEIIKYEMIGVVRPAKIPIEFVNLNPTNQE